MRTTLDYGIDLGTTNSAIARQRGMRSELISGPDGLLVPSVVHLDAEGSVRVGSEAVERRRADAANAAAEFKRLMGTADTVLFPSSGRRLSPVELSAEVLKHLVARAGAAEGEPVEAAVITIPAMFQLPQCEATREASSLAGLRYAPLLQEPIAAAIASAGDADLREGYWLMYDLGGGTFDVSLVRSRGGRLQVLDHDGDNHLGGKDLDRLVARRAADQVRAGGRIRDFHRSDPGLASAFARLRTEAERVRIALSRAEVEEFRVDRLVPGDDGEWVSVSFPLDRGELEALIRPTLSRTAGLCRQMLARNRLGPAELKRLVLVGGPTLTPSLPRILEEELEVEARHFVDPSRAVAIGAAIYASTQRLPAELRRPDGGSRLELQLSYEPMTNDPAPLVAGQLAGARAPGEWRVQLSSLAGGWRSDRLPVRADGSFTARVQLRPGTLNAFAAAVWHEGAPVAGAGREFSIIHGTTVAKPLLSQSVGVVLANNSVRWYLRRGTVLPARHSVSHATTIGVRRGQSANAVHVPLMQGESDWGDRNVVVGVLQIRAENLSRDLPAGSEVVVTLTVDEHSTTTAEAWVPLLGQSFTDVVKFGLETRDSREIHQDVEGQRARLAELERVADDLAGDPDADLDGRVRLIEELLEDGGTDERTQADQMLRKVTELIDSMEVKDRKGRLREAFAEAEEVVGSLLADGDRARALQIEALAEEFDQAVRRNDLQLAETRVKAADDLRWSLLRERPEYWRQLFDDLCRVVLAGPNAAEARVPIDAGKVAVARNDVGALVEACLELIRLLPQGEEAALPTALLSHVA